MRTTRYAVAAALVLATACSRKLPSPLALLDDAAVSAEAAEASARIRALAGFQAYLVASDPARAQARFDEALAQDPSDPYALHGQLLLAERRAQPDRVLAAALDLCERAPGHLLAIAAARTVLDTVGTAAALDELILKRATDIVRAGTKGDAAQLLRSALATVHGQRGAAEGQAAALAQMGVATRFSVAGPFSAFQILDFDTVFSPELTGALDAAAKGPLGAIPPRTLTFPDGRLNLAGEQGPGDVYFVAVDVELAQAGSYVIRSVASAPHKLFVDGALAFERRTFEQPGSNVSARSVALVAGKHRVLVKLAREERGGTLSVALMREDGAPSDATLSPGTGAPASWSGASFGQAAHVFPDAEAYFTALVPEAGEALARFLAVRDGMARDRDGAKRLMAPLSAALSSAPVRLLAAELVQGDRSVPVKVSRGRATRDLEASLEKDPTNVRALLGSAGLALEDGRTLDASELLKRARAAGPTVGFPVPLLQSRVELALGVDAQAEQSALEALRLQPGLCEADELRYDLARRRDAVALSDELVRKLEPCPGSLVRLAEHVKARGKHEQALPLLRKLLSRDVGNTQAAISLTQLLAAQRKFGEAKDALTPLIALWPRNPQLLKRLADVQELSGKPDEALATRERALALDGSDLVLRRSVERARTGKELLQDHAIDGQNAIAAYELARETEEATGAYVLDAAAIRAYPDGSMVDRIHIIQKVLDQSGISELGEVSIPPGAQLLSLRTRKADGSVLEPETFEGKESISLPGVQVGDYVEYEYLQAHAPRGPAQPGFTASAFYFQIARLPNAWSTYTVIAPKGSGMTVDAHNMKAPKARTEGDLEVFFHEERKVPPFIPEPDSPPSGNEFLPFVSVGAGATGQEGLIATYADAFLDRGQRTHEVQAFARAAAGEAKGLDAVKAIHAAVMKSLSGRDSGLAQSAASSLAQDRGSRLWALKASLEAVGIPARLAAVRTFSVDPAPYRFPSESLVPYVCVVAQVGEERLWLDTAVRFAPPGELPEQAMGGREAWLLPEPGRPLEKVTTPPQPARPGKQVRLTLTLDASGQLSGSGEETYQGMEAAQLAEALDALSPDQRNQALQSALSRYFGGAELSKLTLELKREVGAPLTVGYEFRAPRFASVEADGRMVLGALTFPAQLGRRYVQLSGRRTPLFVDGTEQSTTSVSLTLPPGFKLVSPAPEVKAQSPFGTFVRKEQQEGAVVTLREEYRLQMARIPPGQYSRFAQFAGEVDLLQSRDLLVAPK